MMMMMMIIIIITHWLLNIWCQYSSFSDSVPKTGQENDTFSHKEDSRQDTQKVEGSSRQSQI